MTARGGQALPQGRMESSNVETWLNDWMVSGNVWDLPLLLLSLLQIGWINPRR